MHECDGGYVKVGVSATERGMKRSGSGQYHPSVAMPPDV